MKKFITANLGAMQIGICFTFDSSWTAEVSEVIDDDGNTQWTPGGFNQVLGNYQNSDAHASVEKLGKSLEAMVARLEPNLHFEVLI